MKRNIYYNRIQTWSHLFMVHLDKILQEQKSDPKKKKGKRNQADQEDIELRARECGQADFENLQAWIKTQKDKEQEEVQLEEVDVGEEGEGKQVRVSAKLEVQFKDQLVQLLKEYRDVFAWSYTDMEGIDPKCLPTQDKSNRRCYTSKATKVQKES